MLSLKAIFIFISISLIKVDSQSISDSYNRFSFKLYDKLGTNKNENLIYSPYSIQSALSMCLLGARGNTEKQLRSVLGFDTFTNTVELNSGNRQLFSSLRSLNNDNLTLNIANKIYPKQGLTIKQEFLNQLTQTFHSDIQLMDYSNPSVAASTINSWVKEQTNNMIKELLTADSINDDTAMILANAIYFKGKWLNSFDKTNTKTEKFHLNDGTTKDVDMMHLHKTDLKVLERPSGLDATVVEFPYTGETVSMTIILPNENIKLSEIEQKLSLDSLKNIISQKSEPRKVIASVPKFKFEKSFQLSSVLSSMGASDAFDASRADFSGISDEPNLSITNVIHKAVIEVSEEGTEAAAATAVSIGVTSIEFTETPLIFRCDRPFIFIIHETKQNTILFHGKYTQ